MAKLEIEISAVDKASGVLRGIGDVAKTALGVFAGQVLFAGLDKGVDALRGVASESLNMAMDYEASLNLMQAVSGATNEQMAAVRQTAMALGADMSLPATSAADAALAMTELSKAGFDTEQAMAAAKGVLALAAAGTLGEGRAAQIAANALNAFHLEGKQAETVANLLSAASNASSAEVTDLADSLQMSSAVFASAGIPIEELVAAMSSMANAGIIGSDAGTSLKQMILQLQTPTKKSQELMDSLGLSVYDATGKMLPFGNLIGQFTSKLGGLTQKERDFALGTIFGSDAVRAANIIMLGGVDAQDKMEQAVTRQNAAQELSEARMKGLKGAWLGLQSQWETVRLAAMDPLLPVLEEITRAAANVVGSLTPAAGQLGEVVGNKLRPAFAWIRDEAIPYAKELWAVLNDAGPVAVLEAIEVDLTDAWPPAIKVIDTAKIAVEFFKGAWQGVYDVIQPLIMPLLAQIQTELPKIQTLLDTLTGSGTDIGLEGNKKKWQEIGVEMGKFISSPLGIALQQATAQLTLLNSVLDPVNHFLQSLNKTSSDAGGKIDGLRIAFNELGKTVTVIVGGPFVWLQTAWDGLKNTLEEIKTLNVASILGDLHRLGVPGFAAGGLVPGPIGAPMLAVVHGGETVIPAGATNNYNLTINSRAQTEQVASSFYLMQYLARAYQ